MKIGFIGAGKVGTAMGLYLYSKKFKVMGFYSRTKESAEVSSSLINQNTFNNINDLIKGTDIIAITTSDDQISNVVEELNQLEVDWSKKIIFHMSGAHSSDILESVYNKGATVSSLHPMLAFSSNSYQAIQDLEFAQFTIEGKGKLFTDFYKTISNIGNSIVRIATKDKELYHISATFVSNYMVTLFDMGLKMLQDIEFSDEQANALLEPLVKKNINNIFKLGTKTALTGPIARGDIGTIEKHINVLTKYNQQILQIYNILGVKTVELAERADKIDKSLGLRIKEVLQKDGKKDNYSDI